MRCLVKSMIFWCLKKEFLGIRLSHEISAWVNQNSSRYQRFQMAQGHRSLHCSSGAQSGLSWVMPWNGGSPSLRGCPSTQEEFMPSWLLVQCRMDFSWVPCTARMGWGLSPSGQAAPTEQPQRGWGTCLFSREIWAAKPQWRLFAFFSVLRQLPGGVQTPVGVVYQKMCSRGPLKQVNLMNVRAWVAFIAK